MAPRGCRCQRVDHRKHLAALVTCDGCGQVGCLGQGKLAWLGTDGIRHVDNGVGGRGEARIKTAPGMGNQHRSKKTAMGIEVESLPFTTEGDLDLPAFLGLSEEIRPGGTNASDGPRGGSS